MPGDGRRAASTRATHILTFVYIEHDAADLTAGAMYRLLTATVVPRPIAWVSTVSATGVANLAPHSFFTVACVNPPLVQFGSVGEKDTLRNVRDNGEFVVNLAPTALFEQINATGTNFPPGMGEFDALGIERAPSVRVSPPRVAASPVALECALHSTLPLGDTTIVFGRVVHVAIDDAVMVDGHPDIGRLAPLSRLGRDEWATLGDVREIARIPYVDRAGE